MTPLSPPFRPARADDADVLTRLVNYAGEGLALYQWEKLAEPGQTGWDVGLVRARRQTGSFSYRNASVIEVDGACAGCLIGYSIADGAQPIPDDMPTMFRPLQELEDLVPGTWYVNVLAVMPQYRGQGLGTQLLDLGERIGKAEGCRGMSVIVSDSNTGARRLYARSGYVEIASRAMVKDGWENPGKNWVLMKKG